MGANIVPLSVKSGSIKVNIKADSSYTAFLAVSADSGVTYTSVKGSASAGVPSGSEASLIITNTPDQLITYDAFNLNTAVSKGLQYSFTLTGGTVA